MLIFTSEVWANNFSFPGRRRRVQHAFSLIMHVWHQFSWKAAFCWDLSHLLDNCLVCITTKWFKFKGYYSIFSAPSRWFWIRYIGQSEISYYSIVIVILWHVWGIPALHLWGWWMVYDSVNGAAGASLFLGAVSGNNLFMYERVVLGQNNLLLDYQDEQVQLAK